MYLMFAKVGIFIVFYFVKCNLFFIISAKNSHKISPELYFFNQCDGFYMRGAGEHIDGGKFECLISF